MSYNFLQRTGSALRRYTNIFYGTIGPDSGLCAAGVAGGYGEAARARDSEQD